MKKEYLKEAYEIVFADLISNYGGLLVGKHDARSKTSSSFINGIWTVMEIVAYNAGGEEKQDFLNNIFIENIEKSIERANIKIW